MNKKMKIKLVSFGILITLLSCKNSFKSQEISIKDEVLAEAVQVLEQNSIESKKINWESLKTEVIQKYPEVLNDSIRNEAINWIIGKYNLKHHSLMPIEVVKSWRNNSNDKNDGQLIEHPSSRGQLINDNIGYLEMPYLFISGDSTDLVNLAQNTQNIIKDLAEEGAKRWIVDLSKCRGGNMWPMIVGIGPLTGTGKLGSFVDLNNEEVGNWYYKNGKVYSIENEERQIVVEIPLPIQDVKTDKIAVLQSSETGSSGEAMLLSFLGKENVKTFGTKSASYATSNSNFNLSNGAILFVTTSFMTDRNSNIYPNGITPMTKVENDSLIMEEAIKWLNK